MFLFQMKPHFTELKLEHKMYSCMPLYELVIEQFFKDNPDLVEVCQEAFVMRWKMLAQWRTRAPGLPLYNGQMPISCTRWPKRMWWRGCKTGKQKKPRMQCFTPWWTICIGWSNPLLCSSFSERWSPFSTFICKLAKHSACYSLLWIGSDTSESGHAT